MIGQKIRRLRAQRNLTQEELCKGLFDRSYLSMIERGKFEPPLETLQLLAHRLNVPARELVEFDQMVCQIQRMITQAKSSGDPCLIQDAWNFSREIDAIELMSECLIVWAAIEPSSMQLVDALNYTCFILEEYDREFSFKWKLLLLRGTTYFNLGMFEQAITSYQDLLRHHTVPFEDRIRATISIGSSLLAISKYEEAHKYFSSIADQDELRDPILLGRIRQGLGVCCRYLKRWNEALMYFEQAKSLFELKDQRRFIQIQHALRVLWLDKLNFELANF